MHADCPIEQTVRSNDANTQSQLMQEPWSRRNRLERTLFVADCMETGLHRHFEQMMAKKNYAPR